jgi:hypothetical protein
LCHAFPGPRHAPHRVCTCTLSTAHEASQPAPSTSASCGSVLPKVRLTLLPRCATVAETGMRSRLCDGGPEVGQRHLVAGPRQARGRRDAGASGRRRRLRSRLCASAATGPAVARRRESGQAARRVGREAGRLSRAGPPLRRGPAAHVDAAGALALVVAVEPYVLTVHLGRAGQQGWSEADRGEQGAICWALRPPWRRRARPATRPRRGSSPPTATKEGTGAWLQASRVAVQGRRRRW